MRNQFLALLPRWGALAILIAVVVLGAAPRGLVSFVGVVDASSEAAQAPTATTAPRTPWGEPDLQGIYYHAEQTPLERPKEYAGRELLTDEEVAELNRVRAGGQGRDKRAERGTERDVAGAYNAVFNSVKRSGRRTSLVVDPPDPDTAGSRTGSDHHHDQCGRLRRSRRPGVVPGPGWRLSGRASASRPRLRPGSRAWLLAHRSSERSPRTRRRARPARSSPGAPVHRC